MRVSISLRIPVDVGDTAVLGYIAANQLNARSGGQIDSGFERLARTGEVDNTPDDDLAIAWICEGLALKRVLRVSSTPVILYGERMASLGVYGHIEV